MTKIVWFNSSICDYGSIQVFLYLYIYTHNIILKEGIMVLPYVAWHVSHFLSRGLILSSTTLQPIVLQIRSTNCFAVSAPSTHLPTFLCGKGTGREKHVGWHMYCRPTRIQGSGLSGGRLYRCPTWNRLQFGDAKPSTPLMLWPCQLSRCTPQLSTARCAWVYGSSSTFSTSRRKVHTTPNHLSWVNL